MNLLYVVPDLKKVSGGPRTRINMFKNVFIKNGDRVIEGRSKLRKSIKSRKINIVYVESATNRISFTDVICLFVLRLYSNEIIVFIRDIYAELFPHDYNTFRRKITFVLNKISNFYLTLISTSMVFPTNNMGSIFFDKNLLFPSRTYTNLPPGTIEMPVDRAIPDFNQKLGVLYLGSTKYANSGFYNFVDFSRQYSKFYNFFVICRKKYFINLF